MQSRSYNDLIHKKDENDEERLLIKHLLQEYASKIKDLENIIGYSFNNKEIALKCLFNKEFRDCLTKDVFTYVPGL